MQYCNTVILYMNRDHFLDPNNILRWMQSVIDGHCKDELDGRKVKLKISDSIENILESLVWDRWDWILFIVTLEVEFKLEVPDKWTEILEITLGDFISNLTTLKIQSEANWGLEKIRLLGYLYIIAEQEKIKDEKSELTRYKDNLN